MENLWIKSHKFITDSKVGDFYFSGGRKNTVTKRTPKRIHFSDGSIITISKAGDFLHLKGKNVNQILRDIEGYFIHNIHAPLNYE